MRRGERTAELECPDIQVELRDTLTMCKVFGRGRHKTGCQAEEC